MTWKSEAGLRPTAALAGWTNTAGPTSTHTTSAASAQLTASPARGRSRCACRCSHGLTDTATLSQATVQAAWTSVRRLDFRTVGPSPFVRTLVQAAVVLVVLVGLAFGVQAAFLNVPSNAQLVAVDALKALARYHVMDSTEQLSTRPRRSLCFENRVLDRKTDSLSWESRNDVPGISAMPMNAR